MTEELRAALEPFLKAARGLAHYPHWKGEHPFKAQVGKGLYHPTVDEYRTLLDAADKEPE